MRMGCQGVPCKPQTGCTVFDGDEYKRKPSVMVVLLNAFYTAWKKHLDDESLAWSNAGVEWIEDLETV